MVSTRSLLTGLTLLSSTLALPSLHPRDCNFQITAKTLIAIDPKTTACNTTASFASECADAATAAPAITNSFIKYDISSRGAQAALLAIMLFESGSFGYNHNHFPAPGNPGQGTRNMQSAKFNELYATDVVGAEKVKAAKAGAKAGQDPKDAVLALVNAKADDSFGSAAWFLTTQCEAGVKEALADGSEEGWEAYLTECVGTTAAKERNPSWVKAKEVLGVSSASASA